jgi:hypothetical protein
MKELYQKPEFIHCTKLRCQLHAPATLLPKTEPDNP